MEYEPHRHENEAGRHLHGSLAPHAGQVDGPPGSLNRVAVSATLHCLTGCAIGEVLGMVIGTALGWGNGATTVLAIILAIPGAMDAGLVEPLFWGSLALSLVIAGAAACPVNRWLIARGRGHAVVHQQHAH